MSLCSRAHSLKRPHRWIAALIFAPVAAVALAGCGDDGGKSMGNGNMPGGGMNSGLMDGAPVGAILVRLSNWSIDTSTSSFRAGEITFRAVHAMQDMHRGGEGKTHELVVARKNADGSFDLVGEAEDIGIGQHKDLTLQLARGNYELQCNVVEEINGKNVAHYTNGMHTPFTVT